jgi:hypothetical protein
MAALFESSFDSFLHHQNSSLLHESSKDDTKSCLQAIDNGPAFMKRRHSSITKLGRFWTWLATDSWTLEYAALIVAVVSLAYWHHTRDLPRSSFIGVEAQRYSEYDPLHISHKS